MGFKGWKQERREEKQEKREENRRDNRRDNRRETNRKEKKSKNEFCHGSVFAFRNVCIHRLPYWCVGILYWP
jgi:hypothetical protein